MEWVGLNVSLAANKLMPYKWAFSRQFLCHIFPPLFEYRLEKCVLLLWLVILCALPATATAIHRWFIVPKKTRKIAEAFEWIEGAQKVSQGHGNGAGGWKIQLKSHLICVECIRTEYAISNVAESKAHCVLPINSCASFYYSFPTYSSLHFYLQLYGCLSRTGLNAKIRTSSR